MKLGGNFCCPYCLVNMNHDAHTVEKWPVMREIQEDGSLGVNIAGEAHQRKRADYIQSKKDFGIAPGEKPALSIPLIKYVVDILHMKLRIGERFLLVFVQVLVDAETVHSKKFAPRNQHTSPLPSDFLIFYQDRSF